MTEIVLVYAGLVLCLVLGRIKDQRREAAFWHGEFVRWSELHQQLWTHIFGKPRLQMVHDEIVTEFKMGESWDDVPELEIVGDTKDND